jgi:cell division protein FtsN
MNKKRLVVIILVAVFATCALAIANGIAQKSDPQGQISVSSPSGLKTKPADLERTTPPGPAQSNPRGDVSSQPQESHDIPQYVVYSQVFRHIKELHKKADDEERQGRNGEQFRKLYQQMASLNDVQTSQLDQIATETNDEIEKLNARAMQIIKEVRAKHPDGKLAQGELPPTPPAELGELSAKRRDVILQARERIRSVFGEGEFQRFDKFLQERMKPAIRRLGNAGTQPAGAQNQ